MKPTIIFAGSGDFGKTVLTVLCNNFNVVRVITQPARKAGKTGKLQETPVATLATSFHLSVTTPNTNEQLLTDFTSIKADIVIVADYGKIIPQIVLDSLPAGIINIHPSLLPKYRGPSPLQSTILNGDKETGVTIMLMDSKMDHGPMLAQEKIVLSGQETTPQLSEILAMRGALLLSQISPAILNGLQESINQDHSTAIYCKLIKKEHGLISSADSIVSVERKFRALQPWPGIYLRQVVNGRELQIKIIEVGQSVPSVDKSGPNILIIHNSKLYLRLKDGCLEVLSLQPEGKRSMNSDEFIRGYKLN